MIVDLARFVETERPYWKALQETLHWLESSPGRKLTVEEAERFHLLYQRTAADLGRISSFAAEGGLRQHLEWLVSRAYAEIHESRGRSPLRPWRWVTHAFPQAFRRHFQAFQLSVALTLVGVLFGGLALKFDPEAKAVLMPFEGLQMSPAERVAKEKEDRGKTLSGHKGTFSAQLMTHNTQVALLTLALGATFGFGTIAVLFYNGVILGAVILIGGQAGLVIAFALIGWGSRISRAERLRNILPDVVMLAVGCAVMLVWAGIVEAFVSQYHEPVIRYEWKIAFGLVEAALLTLFLWRAGRGASE